ncbi:hypothetical protein GCM10009801_04320 [Streptomyces albiaxialis]|uniref:Ribbon-helix-helix protein CopG domain-containing protein n=1 Tax=Streptomyces albiaxialis TaxID=329523 RepID=A0ABP5H3D8_9ACTN
MATRMLSVRIDSETLESVKERAEARGMTVQEFVVRNLQRDGFHDRFMESATEALEVYYDALSHVDTNAKPTTGSAPDIDEEPL